MSLSAAPWGIIHRDLQYLQWIGVWDCTGHLSGADWRLQFHGPDRDQGFQIRPISTTVWVTTLCACQKSQQNLKEYRGEWVWSSGTNIRDGALNWRDSTGQMWWYSRSLLAATRPCLLVRTFLPLHWSTYQTCRSPWYDSGTRTPYCLVTSTPTSANPRTHSVIRYLIWWWSSCW